MKLYGTSIVNSEVSRVALPQYTVLLLHPFFASLPNPPANVLYYPLDDLLDRFLRDLCETDPHNEKLRIEDDKGGLLKSCSAWILNDPQLQSWQNSQDTRLLWIKGDPGKGKTMLMIGLVDMLTDDLKNSSAISYF